MSERTLRIVYRQNKNAPKSSAENTPSETPRNLMDEIQIIAFLDPPAYEAIRGYSRDKVASLTAKTVRHYRIALASLSVLSLF